ncbi:unnamed protein product [Coffea canephora]|uniref:Uncharacterized protein n=1 Tax=Coffea canephora TaxID=49390 RepID=A0A068TZ75_COFCA|nr:unnamed protein product [Coffea canephora]
MHHRTDSLTKRDDACFPSFSFEKLKFHFSSPRKKASVFHQERSKICLEFSRAFCRTNWSPSAW